jgi:hypothetical protein
MDRSRFLLLIGDQVIRDLVIGDQGGGRMETGGLGGAPSGRTYGRRLHEGERRVWRCSHTIRTVKENSIIKV